jgi:hypothetical protein
MMLPPRAWMLQQRHRQLAVAADLVVVVVADAIICRKTF